ncbi:hypothetical protein ACHAWF_013207 [Thalassiosira exigua]
MSASPHIIPHDFITASFHNHDHHQLATRVHRFRSNDTISWNRVKHSRSWSSSSHTRLFSTASKSPQTTPSQIVNSPASSAEANSNTSAFARYFNKYFTTETSPKDVSPPQHIKTTPKDNSTPQPIEEQLSELRSEIAQLSYLIKQTSSQQVETQNLARRAEARAYIIENKLLDIQHHVVRIPALETLALNLRQYLREYRPPAFVGDAFRRASERVNESGAASFLTSKYAAWTLLAGVVLFWQYRMAMYRRTSEEMANVAALTLQQDSLRATIQETLTTVANSPETLASLGVLFRSLVSEERTEKQLIDLIVRALSSEGVRDAAIALLGVCFENEYLRGQAGEFLKVAATETVLDENVQRSAGTGMQRALWGAMLPPWRVKGSGAVNKTGDVRDGEVEVDNGGTDIGEDGEELPPPAGGDSDAGGYGQQEDARR